MTEQNKRIIELLAQTGTVDKATLQEKLKKLYYETGNSPISDEEYDSLFGNNDYVGYTPEQNGPWEVLEHKIAMGSLEKLKTWEQAVNWLKDKKDTLWQPKLDGLSIELVYSFGELVHAILRGGGDKGEDILRNAERFIGVPHTIDTNNNMYVSIRGEVVIAQSKFEQLCSISQDAYKNRRNCIPGICRRYDGQYSEFLSFYAYDIVTEYNEAEGRKEYASYQEKLRDIYNYGFKLPFTLFDMNEAQYIDYGNMRDIAEQFQMDGLVLKTNDMQHQIALKFEPKGELTKITGYSWEIGSTGKYVPKALFETVNVGGSNLSQAAIGSYDGYLELNAPIGSIVEVRKMGDVIPKVTKVIKRTNEELEIPKECPYCHKPLEKQGADLYCVNKQCPVKQIDKLYAVYRPVAMKGIKENWIEALMNKGILTKCYHVPLVRVEDIAQLDGYSEQRAIKLLNHITGEYTKLIQTQDVKWFLYMLPIPTVSGKAVEKLSSIFHNFVEFKSWLSEWSIERQKQLTDLLGNAKGNKAYDYISENREDITKLLEILGGIANQHC